MVDQEGGLGGYSRGGGEGGGGGGLGQSLSLSSSVCCLLLWCLHLLHRVPFRCMATAPFPLRVCPFRVARESAHLVEGAGSAPALCKRRERRGWRLKIATGGRSHAHILSLFLSSRRPRQPSSSSSLPPPSPLFWWDRDCLVQQ